MSGVRYTASFYSIANILWRVDIIDNDYSGGVNQFLTGPEGFENHYRGVEDRNDPILASELKVPFIIQESAHETFIQDILNSQENRFTVKVYKSSALFWVGVLLPDQALNEDISFPYIVNLKFTDGLARLKDVKYADYTAGIPYPYVGRETIIQHLMRVFGKIGIYSTSDNILVTIVNWYEYHHTYGQSYDPLNYTDLDHQCFLSDGEEGVVNYKTCYDVLKDLCTLFNARVFHANGMFYFMQVQEMLRAYTYERTYNKSGSLVGSNSVSYRLYSAQRMAGGMSKYYTALHHVTRTYRYYATYRKDGNLLPYHATYATAQPWLNYVDYSSGLVGILKGTIKQIYRDNTPSTLCPVLIVQYKLEVQFTNVTTYYLTNKNGTMEWSSTAGDYVLVESPMYEDLGYLSTSFDFEFTVPAVPTNTQNGTVKLTKMGYINALGNTVTLPSGDTFAYAPSNFSMVFTNIDTTSLNGQTVYTAINFTSGGSESTSTKYIDNGVLTIGEGTVTSVITRMRCKPASGSTWYPVAGWRVHNSGSYKGSIHQLAVEQNLMGQKVAVERYNGTFNGVNVRPTTIIVWGNRILAPISMNVIPVEDSISGEWFNLNVAT